MRLPQHLFYRAKKKLCTAHCKKIDALEVSWNCWHCGGRCDGKWMHKQENHIKRNDDNNIGMEMGIEEGEWRKKRKWRS